MRLPADRHIARPAREVFDFFADASNNPKWQDGMVCCEWTSEPPIAVGSTYDQRARFMGRQVMSSFIVSDYERVGGSPSRPRSRPSQSRSSEQWSPSTRAPVG